MVQRRPEQRPSDRNLFPGLPMHLHAWEFSTKVAKTEVKHSKQETFFYKILRDSDHYCPEGAEEGVTESVGAASAAGGEEDVAVHVCPEGMAGPRCRNQCQET